MNFNIEKKGYNKSEVDFCIAELQKVSGEQKNRILELRRSLDTAEGELKTFRESKDLISKSIINAVSKADQIEKLAQLKYSQDMAQLKAFHDKWLSYYNKVLKRYPLNEELLATSSFNSEMSRILQKADSGNMVCDEGEALYQKEAERLGLAGDGQNKVVSQQNAEDYPSGERQIGYIKVKTPEADGGQDIAAEDEQFDPVARIRAYLGSRPHEDKAKSAKPKHKDEDASTVAPNAKSVKSQNNATVSGFSFEEALNPTENLEDIMKELGLLPD